MSLCRCEGVRKASARLKRFPRLAGRGLAGRGLAGRGGWGWGIDKVFGLGILDQSSCGVLNLAYARPSRISTFAQVFGGIISR
jgi:hypothetical protein